MERDLPLVGWNLGDSELAMTAAKAQDGETPDRTGHAEEAFRSALLRSHQTRHYVDDDVPIAERAVLSCIQHYFRTD